jgi:DNA-binding transcriptional MerR regulator
MGCEDHNARRRDKYKEDPEYRARVRGWNAAGRQRTKEAVLEAVKVRPVSGSWKTVEIEIDGVLTKVFTVGALAKAIGKGVSTIRMWERNGVLPQTPYRSPRGDRLYTLEMVEQVREAMRRSGKLKQALLEPISKPPFLVRKVRFGDEAPVVMRLYKVGSLAQAANRTVASLFLMEKRGGLPKTPLIASDLKYRLYTVEMIEVVQRAFAKRGGRIRGRADWLGFYEEIVREWTRLGVMDARVEDEDESGDERDEGARS